jgi:integrase
MSRRKTSQVRRERRVKARTGKTSPDSITTASPSLDNGTKWQTVTPYDLMFCTQTGKPMNPRNLLRHFYKVQERLGWGEWLEADGKRRFDPWFRFHDLRHTASQHMEDAGVQDKVRAAILGHASVKDAREIYTHASKEAKRAAVEKLQRKQS